MNQVFYEQHPICENLTEFSDKEVFFFNCGKKGPINGILLVKPLEGKK